MKSLSTPKPSCSLRKSAKVAIITGTRAEWGLLSPLAHKIYNDSSLTLQLIATGSHLSPALGNTYQEIELEGFSLTAKIPILQSDCTTHLDTAHALSHTISSFSEYFYTHKPDMALLLGDRYEAFGVAIACANLNIPIAHLCGGETTQGANDEYMRHCITKMSYLHFATTQEYANRIIQLGEQPKRVFNVGSLAVENTLHTPFLDKNTLCSSLHLCREFIQDFCVLTFHPSTLEATSPKREITLLVNALLQSGVHILATKANADTGGNIINEVLQSFAQIYPKRITLCASLGRVGYLSALKYAKFVIGNSSSGLSEAPILRIPTINIGDRQKGRITPDSVISIAPNPSDESCYTQSILSAIRRIKSADFQASLQALSHPFGDGSTSEQITQILKSTLEHTPLDLKKSFYTLPNFSAQS